MHSGEDHAWRNDPQTGTDRQSDLSVNITVSITHLCPPFLSVVFSKHFASLLGAADKMTFCVWAKYWHKYFQATLHVGDEIREINGISVANQSIESLQKLLREARGSVTFKVGHFKSLEIYTATLSSLYWTGCWTWAWKFCQKIRFYLNIFPLQIVPSYRSAPPPCDIFVRAQFEYDPMDDDLIPCAQAGIPFNTGDILQIISKDDHNWWQARKVAAAGTAGLIPSPELQVQDRGWESSVIG